MQVQIDNRVVFMALQDAEFFSRFIEMNIPVIEPVNNRASLVSFQTPLRNYERVVRKGHEAEAINQLVALAFDTEVS